MRRDGRVVDISNNYGFLGAWNPFLKLDWGSGGKGGGPPLSLASILSDLEGWLCHVFARDMLTSTFIYEAYSSS